MTANPQSRKLTALVTGGASGIGLSTVKHFLKKGVRVVLADFNEDGGKAVVDDLRKAGQDATFIPVNITTEESITACICKAVEALGVIDIAVNCAGVTGPMYDVHELPEEEYRKIMTVDLDGCWRFSKAMITYFRAQEPRFVRHDKGVAWEPVYQRGSLVNVASSIGSVAQYKLGAYCAAKAGVILLSKAMALENAEHGIRVNTISPGLTFTPLMRSDPGFDLAYATKTYLKDQPIGRFGHPDEIAAGIVFTALDGASFMTGSDWGPDGGYHLA